GTETQLSRTRAKCPVLIVKLGDTFNREQRMKITAAKVIVTSPSRNFVTLKIMTDEGIHGIGDGTLNGREKSVVSYLADYTIPALTSLDQHQIEDTCQFFHHGAYCR